MSGMDVLRTSWSEICAAASAALMSAIKTALTMAGLLALGGSRCQFTLTAGWNSAYTPPKSRRGFNEGEVSIVFVLHTVAFRIFTACSRPYRNHSRCGDGSQRSRCCGRESYCQRTGHRTHAPDGERR